MKPTHIILVTISVLISGCIPSGKPFITSKTPAFEELPTNTPTPIVTPTLSPTNTPVSENKAVFSCPSIQDQFPDTVAIQGKFILSPLATDASPYLLDFSTGSQSYLPFTEAYYPKPFKVSPNYQWVAYFTKRRDDTDTIADFSLIITDSNGNVVYQENMDITKKWFLIDTWLDNQTLMLERYQTLPESNTLDTPLPVTLFNPFTGESRDMDGDFPNMLFFFEPLAQWDVFGKSGTAYDPTVSLVAYASDSRDDHRQSIVLWDINSNQEITRIQAAGDFGSGPVWSPDGSQFILDSLAKIPSDPRKWTEEERLSEEIFSVSRTGEITRLTFLTEQFQEVSIDSYRWSPDGRYIAFDVLTKPDIDPSNELSGSHSAILDTHTKEIRIYCYKSYPGTGRYFWSPDGTSLLTGIENPEKADAYSTILIDLISNVTVKVADETIPVGWIIQQ